MLFLCVCFERGVTKHYRNDSRVYHVGVDFNGRYNDMLWLVAKLVDSIVICNGFLENAIEITVM